MSDSENSETKKATEPADTSADLLSYQFFDATKDYSFTSFSSQPTPAEPAPATASPAVVAAADVVDSATTTPVAPPTPPSAPAPVVLANPAATPVEPTRPADLSFGPNFNFTRSIKRVFTALDIDLSNRVTRKELADGMASNKLHGDEYLLALTLLDYYDEIHKNVFGTGGADMGASVEEILTYIGIKQENKSPADFVRRASRNSWSHD